MRYSNTAITELSAKYRSILKKCALLNAAILLSTVVALPAGAAITERVVIEPGSERFVADGAVDFSFDGDGGVFYNKGTLHLNGGQSFLNNSVTGKGGVVYNKGTLIISDNSLFKDNKAYTLSSHGSDIYNESSGVIEIGNSVSFVRSSTYYDDTVQHDCGIYSPSGGKISIGNNLTISGIGEAVVVGKIDFSVGDNATFSGNQRALCFWGGEVEIGKNSLFTNNQYQAIHTSTGNTINEIIVGDNAIFRKNVTPTSWGWGNVFINSKSSIEFLGTSQFIDNATPKNGNTVLHNQNKMIFDGNATFVGNMANGDAAALFNETASSTVEFKSDATFKGNKVTGVGGAILNNGEIIFKNVEFSENYQGGISKYIEDDNGLFDSEGNFVDNFFNEGDPSYTGQRYSFVVSGGTKNDIQNNGKITFLGKTILDGGVVNEGTITFASGSSLKAVLNGSTIISGSGTIEGTTELILGNASDGQTFVMEGDKDGFGFAPNSLYSIVLDGDDKTYTISKKSTDTVVENLTKNGEATAQEAATISAIADTKVSNPLLDKITEAVQSGDVKTAAKAAKDLAPTTSQAALGISKDVQSLLTNAATARMAGLAGRAGGDVFKGGSMWVQGLFNHTKQDSTSRNEGFKANSKGIAFGIDGKLNDAVTLGLGYGYTRTDADAGNRDIDVDGNNFFAYAEYAPDAWYVNGVLNFGYGRYTEKKSPMGYTKKSKYDVYTYGANLMTGYAFESGLTPEGGLRYLLVDQKSYDDGIQKISTSNNDVLTAVLGAKYGYKVKAKDWMFTPNVRLAATYDVMSDGSKAVASVTGGSSYQITGERLHRLGFEAGVGVTSTWNNWDFILSYDGGFRKDYQSHTGTLKAKYHF